MAALLKAQQDMVARCQQDSEELAQLRRERSAAPPLYRAVTGAGYDTETAAPTLDADPAPVGQDRQEEEIRWPVGTR